MHGKTSRLFAFEDTIDVSRSASVLVDKINAVRNQNAIGNILSAGADRREFMLDRKRVDQFAMS